MNSSAEVKLILLNFIQLKFFFLQAEFYSSKPGSTRGSAY